MNSASRKMPVIFEVSTQNYVLETISHKRRFLLVPLDQYGFQANEAQIQTAHIELPMGSRFLKNSFLIGSWLTNWVSREIELRFEFLGVETQYYFLKMFFF